MPVVAGWIGLIAVVLLIGFSAVRYRQDIAVIWPQSAGVYSSLGMNVNASGIDFRHVDYHRENEDGQVVLAVTGTSSTGARELPVPQTVRVTLSDADNRELYHWPFTPAAQTLKPGQSVPFPPGCPARPPRRAIWKCVSPKTDNEHPAASSFPPKTAIAARCARWRRRLPAPLVPDIAMPVLVGGFVFAADLLRALAWEGVAMDVEMIWLRSYGDKRVASAISMIAGPSEQIAGRHVLVIDGVLDAGRTIAKAVSLIQAAGAASVQVAVMLDKQRGDAVAKADYVGFTAGNDFVVGYGMDDAGAATCGAVCPISRFFVFWVRAQSAK